MAASNVPTRRITRMNSGNNLQITNPIYKDYILDKNKAIHRKNDACSKLHIESTMKPGNNLVLEFSTAVYELARLSLSKIIDNSTQYFGLIRHSDENLGANVDSCIKVFNRKNDNTQGKTLLKNGTDQNLPAATKTCRDNIADLAIELRGGESKDSEHDPVDICPICNTTSLLDTIECTECSLWIHYHCAGLSQSAVDALNTLAFVCSLCTDNMLYHADSSAYNRSQTLQMVTCSSLSDDDNNPEASPPIYELSDTEETIVKEISIPHATHDQIKSPKVNSILNSSTKGNETRPQTPPTSEQTSTENLQKKAERQHSKAAKSKIINTEEDKAYIFKLENEINKLKSTIELQNSLQNLQEHQQASSFSANNIQQSSQPNPQTSNFGSSNIDEQRIRMLEFQMMQNMSMNNMLANQQMQMMMQQQQMMQQSFLHSTAGFSTYPHMAIPRHIPPSPGYVPNVIPNSAPNGIYAPPGVSYHHPQYHRQFQPPPYPQFNAAQNLQHQNVNQSYNSQHIQRDLRVNLPQPKPSVSQTDRSAKKHKHQQNENMTNVRQAQSKEGSPLFNSPGDIPCDNSADSSPHDGQHPMQTISSPNYSPHSDMATDVTSRDCLPTTKVDDPEPEISHNSFLGLSQNNIPPDLGLNKNPTKSPILKTNFSK
ncbi:unnamed protein product [Mytilus coruscus]|uniref:Zinc finger PHD-type domain-containing protein n=1 Tax=Mytilus coruscus TaxID=42192 RepID=A0A6J8CLS2_MYTCO|nr:unnamed protein product [Mytilus coruscus]